MTVYFIKPIGMDGPVKIGSSGSPDRRRRSLQTWSPFPLEIVAEIDGGVHLERRFHARFRLSHQNREWFAATPELRAVIAAINAGTFDIETLPGPEYVTHNKEAARAAHKASWTEDRRMKASYCARIRWAQNKTLTVCPHFFTMVGDPDVRAAVDAYLADPAGVGEPLHEYRARTGSFPWWARKIPVARKVAA